MRKAAFTKFIDSLSEEELRSELSQMYDKYKEVKAHYAMELGSEKDRQRVFQSAKKDIAAKYKTKSYRRPKRPRISKVKTILKKMEKISIFKEEMADLYFYNCECILHFIEEYDFHSDPLYNNLGESFQKGVDLVMMSMQEEAFTSRCKDIVERTFGINEFLGEDINQCYKNVFDE